LSSVWLHEISNQYGFLAALNELAFWRCGDVTYKIYNQIWLLPHSRCHRSIKCHNIISATSGFGDVSKLLYLWSKQRSIMKTLMERVILEIWESGNEGQVDSLLSSHDCSDAYDNCDIRCVVYPKLIIKKPILRA